MTTRRDLRDRYRGDRDLVPARVRRWLYTVVTAVIPLLIAYGVVTAETAPLWVALAGSMLATGTAVAYTPRHDDAE